MTTNVQFIDNFLKRIAKEVTVDLDKSPFKVNIKIKQLSRDHWNARIRAQVGKYSTEIGSLSVSGASTIEEVQESAIEELIEIVKSNIKYDIDDESMERFQE